MDNVSGKNHQISWLLEGPRGLQEGLSGTGRMSGEHTGLHHGFGTLQHPGLDGRRQSVA